MELIEAPAFTRSLYACPDEEQYRALQNELMKNPEAGDVMPGTGGFRKMRRADPERGKGRRGGLRIIYYYFSTDQQIWLMMLYGKNEAADLSAAEKKALKAAVDRETAVRAERRAAGSRRPGRK
ncbi:MAG TPA: hypothetical protein VHX60_12570 [Acidobacteriaceae bacterium]|jgi:hypothetical protein|nr:hypothetical protein [Acidobacteriaceae bacterium]